MELFIIEGTDVGRFPKLMDQAFQLRHQVFVEEKGWESLRQRDGREIDEFDHAHAQHVLLVKDGRVAVYSRILPTIYPHLLANVYPYLAPRGIPRGPQIWEWTRLCIAAPVRGDGRWSFGSGEMLRAVFEHCLENDVDTLTWQGHPDWLLRFDRLGIRARPLGLPTRVENEIAVSAAMDITPQALDVLIGRNIPAAQRHPVRVPELLH